MRALIAIAIVCIASTAIAAVEDDLRDGDKYFEQGDWKRAAGSYDRAIAKEPGQVSAEAYGKRAAIYIIQKDFKAGLDFIAKAKARFPAAPEILEQEAVMLWEVDQHDKAIEVAEKVVVARPQAFSNQKLLGEYYASRDPAKTAAAYEAYLKYRPGDLESGDVMPRIRLGFAYLANARAQLGTDDAKAHELYARAADQFDVIAHKFSKKPNAQVNADNGLCAANTGLERWDQAVTVCERITGDAKHIDANASVWFNLATAYLARKQTKKARTAGVEFVKARSKEARGYILVGDTYFAERDWANALDQYVKAEKLIRPNQPHDQIQLSIRLGKTYRRLPPPPTGPNNNLGLAIDKLTVAFNANPNSFELALELGGAFIEAHQDVKATALTERLIAGPELAKANVDTRAAVLVLAGKSLFNQHKLKESRTRFEAARELRGNDVQIQRELVLTINEQAYETKDARGSQGLLEQALQIDPASAVTLTNLAVLALDRGECESSRQQLAKLETVRGSDAVLRLRLLARTWLCGTKPDTKRAAEIYGQAAAEAKKANQGLVLAEINTEWAPLIWDSELAQAVDMLEAAVQASASDPAISAAAKRNLALALFRRGWKQMHEGKAADAVADFERASRDQGVLKGTEPLAFEFSLAVAELDAGRATDASKAFHSLAGKGNQGAYLKPPYAKVGSQFFAAYANYRTGTLAARQQAAVDFAKLEGEMAGDKIKELLAASWESIAFEQWRGGQGGAAVASLKNADKYAAGDAKRRIAMDKAALSLDKSDLATIEGLGGNPPESLVNLGILYDMLGRSKDAYEAWVRAKARGVISRDLQRWIDAKKRIYGY